MRHKKAGENAADNHPRLGLAGNQLLATHAL